MSALAKPGLFTPNSNAGAISAPVNLDHVMTIETIDFADYTTTEFPQDDYGIQFTMLSTDNQHKVVTWRYSDSGVRDTDYANAVAAFAASL